MEKIEHKKLKESIRKRDNYTCQRCGLKWIKGEKTFPIHHLEFDKDGQNPGYDYDFNNQDKLITLCPKCNINDFGRIIR